MTKIKGMDISNYQGKISVANFKKAKAAGIQFVILKIGYTGYEKFQCKLDDSFENNYKNAKAAGLPVGGYYYSLANGPITGGEEADFTIKHTKGKTFEYPIYLDVEDGKYRQKNASKKNLADACNVWCKKIAAAGFIPGVYASTSWFNNKIGPITAPHTKWVAQYYKKCEYKGAYDMWQYSSSEGVPGISSKTDVNWCYKEFKKPAAKPATTQAAKPATTNTTVKYETKKVGYTGTFPKLPARGYFKRGDNSKQVKYLQLFLNWFNSKYGLVIDGVIGSKTIRAVERFQKDTGLAVDGLFGKKCLKKAKEYKKSIQVKVEEKKPTTPKPTTPTTPKPTTPTTPKPTASTPPKPVTSNTTTVKKGYTGEFPSLTIKKTSQEVIDDTVSWSKMIANDNRFHYGYTNKKKGVDAHHNGCYFCGTQGKNKNGIIDKQFSYCCNPFIHAAWSHGGQVPQMLKICKNGSSYGFSASEGYAKSKLFKALGHPSKSSLKKGDVLCNDEHVAMYIGNGQLVEAAGGDNNKRNSKSWNNSISYKKMSDSRYKGFSRVYRYIGGPINTTKSIEYGEINKEIIKLQKYLNWYNNYNLVADGKFMDKTLAAVKDFQKKEGLKADGIVGQKTLEKMKAIKK